MKRPTDLTLWVVLLALWVVPPTAAQDTAPASGACRSRGAGSRYRGFD